LNEASSSWESSELNTIFIVSDGRGRTAEQVLRAALVQFENKRYEMVLKAEVRTVEQVVLAVEEAWASNATIFYTLVSEETRAVMKKASEELLVPAVDLLGATLTALHDVFHSRPGSTPGLLYEVDRDSIDRHDAIDYVLKHDDGQYPHELDQADVIIVGVSRVSKSSTCFYLAYEGIRAANVPLVAGIPPPKQLLEVEPSKVVGLTQNVLRLRMIREARVASRNLRSVDDYLDKRGIAEELRYANQLMRRHGWLSVDVSYLAVEEIAKRVMDLCGFRWRGRS
jgi:regulator of PEP synthase PpsR (kinase-PPPase family)